MALGDVVDNSVFVAFQLISILLKKFCVTDHPNKFQLFEEYKADGRADGMCSVVVLMIRIENCPDTGFLLETQ